jgi:hypothetical protein
MPWLRALALLVMSACGRIGFDPGGAGSNGAGGDGDGAVGNGDGFVRGDVLFTSNVAFVSQPTVVLGTLGTVQAGDAICQAEADAASLPGTYVAWLSTSTVNAIDRLAGSRGWVRADGLPFVDTVADLAAGTLFAPLAVDASGAALPSMTAVFTGTLPDGTVDPFTCQNYTTTGDLIAYGVANMTSGGWTRVNASFMSCGANVPIYCFGTGSTTPITIPQVPSRRAFLSDPWVSGGGIGDADARCQQNASAAGLSGAAGFRALLATTSASAVSRFGDGLPWARLDGLTLAATAQDVLAGNFQVPLALDAGGVHMTDTGPAWFGASTFTGVGTTTCVDWSVSNNGNSAMGLSYNTVPPTTSSSMCGTGSRLFCLEQ